MIPWLQYYLSSKLNIFIGNTMESHGKPTCATLAQRQERLGQYGQEKKVKTSNHFSNR